MAMPTWLEEWRKTGKLPKGRKVPITAEEYWAEFFAVMNPCAEEMCPKGSSSEGS